MPTLDEMLRGAMEETDLLTHYSKVARYPKLGGFKSFLNPLVKGRNIRYCMDIKEIRPLEKTIQFESGEQWRYDRIISTIPLTELCKKMWMFRMRS